MTEQNNKLEYENREAAKETPQGQNNAEDYDRGGIRPRLYGLSGRNQVSLYRRKL